VWDKSINHKNVICNITKYSKFMIPPESKISRPQFNWFTLYISTGHGSEVVEFFFVKEELVAYPWSEFSVSRGIKRPTHTDGAIYIRLKHAVRMNPDATIGLKSWRQSLWNTKHHRYIQRSCLSWANSCWSCLRYNLHVQQRHQRPLANCTNLRNRQQI
jgi:hypothetical protein